VWLFASQANMERFLANPSRYVPQFGGYDTLAVGSGSSGILSPIDGPIWAASVAGRPYFFSSNPESLDLGPPPPGAARNTMTAPAMAGAPVAQLIELAAANWAQARTGRLQLESDPRRQRRSSGSVR
jgi:hypothetical protein